MIDLPTTIESRLLHDLLPSADTAHQQVYPVEESTSKTDYGQDDLPDSSTATAENQSRIRRHIDSLVRSAKGELFEDGMDSGFSLGLFAAVAQHGKHAVTELGRQILGGTASSEIASEALRWLGRMPDIQSYRARRWLLERSLLCPCPRVRDGAIVGLASMGDPHSAAYVGQAVERETVDELRRDMAVVLDYLGALSGAVLTAKNSEESLV